MKHNYTTYNNFNNHLSSKNITNLKSSQASPIFYRNNMISKINLILSAPLNPLDNNIQIFYLSVHYLDLVLSQKYFNLSNSINQTYLPITSLILSLKFIGIYDNKITKFVRSILQKYKIENYTLFESQVLKCLNYKLSYITPYDYICFFLSNHLYKDVKNLSLNILKWFVNNNKFISYSSLTIGFAIIKFAQKLMKVTLLVPSIKGVNDNKEQIETLLNYFHEEYDVNTFKSENESKWVDSKSLGCITHREPVKSNLKINVNTCITDRKHISNHHENKNNNITNNNRDNYVYKKKIISRNNSPYQAKLVPTKTINLNKRYVDNKKINLSKITKISIDNIGKLCTRYLRTEV
jgi:hypothetical protein